MFETYIFSVMLIFTLSIVVWFIAQKKKDNSIADISWGLGFSLIALFSCLYNQAFSSRQLLITLFTILWGCRLAFHIWSRKRGKGEDFRYQAMRKSWGEKQALLSLLQVFLLQGLLLLLIVTPVLLINSTLQTDLTWLDYLAIAIFDLGFTFEVIGDFQLNEFLKKPDNKGKLLQSGLWSFTRHPNYFGEVTLWWGIWLFALSSGWGTATIIGPLTISYLILKVSGIPLLEKKYDGNKEFEKYKMRTSAFFPWFPKEKI